ncbi:regulation of nuclear pre-mRNA domain-containing protein 2-like [Hordeum vulgare subsp. vulgare]|uniref:Predicted protein n=1 Tax=Hordeum vulgare subsp. vulgare TaxID=112509 RepID=F2D655_HORVV|nr:regulation of nuclear pre-mRNA domain-containing protein 2-like [Hordeum vulgare subsp. vulgare]XP_044980980.1 regulation of nuclear pre-mRNA domain-containing protein 2-like [Hordeum vulgare subsp. vulgare]XP_044980981.1 regulation of nuclear pre-mRNA domain-containing protein 2-like [Hordeum vulgare subsp. vulgare]BAJ90576.1 predicted protein [Hordeum vulgare subsp. vulgare]
MAGTKADAKADTSGGGGGSFSEKGLAEKLTKLNSSAASIQTLSHWCVFHRKRARRIVDTWEKQFNNATKDKKVSFLYLSNDILQNSKRKGGEFVNEFWKVLPGSLKDVHDSGGEHGKKVVARLIGIWDERKVFGTRIESLKVDILGENPPTLDNNDNGSNPSPNPSSNPKAVRKDSSTYIKELTVCGMPEKIVTAYQSVVDQYFDEDAALNKCKTTVNVLEKMDKDVDNACTHGIPQASSLVSDLQEQEAVLKNCIEQLESVDTARTNLINQLKVALSEQEAKSELLRTQLQVARAEAEHAMQLRQRLGGAPVTNGAGSSSSPSMVTFTSEQTAAAVQNSEARPISPQFQPVHQATSPPTMTSAMVDEPKITAAAMADKLASLSSGQQVLSSIFSSLAAEQAASINGGSPSGELSSGPPGFDRPKRPRLEQQAGDTGAPPFFAQVPQVQQQIGAAPTSHGSTQSLAQVNQVPGSFAPPPLQPMVPQLMQQFSQNTGGPGGMFGMIPFGMMAGSLPPPLPLLPAGFAMPNGPPPPPPLPPMQNHHQQQQSPQAPQQSPTSTGFFPTSSTGFFPPVQVQQSPSVQRQ